LSRCQLLNPEESVLLPSMWVPCFIQTWYSFSNLFHGLVKGVHESLGDTILPLSLYISLL
jgi:hypothetical protein